MFLSVILPFWLIGSSVLEINRQKSLSGLTVFLLQLGAHPEMLSPTEHEHEWALPRLSMLRNGPTLAFSSDYKSTPFVESPCFLCCSRALFWEELPHTPSLLQEIHLSLLSSLGFAWIFSSCTPLMWTHCILLHSHWYLKLLNPYSALSAVSYSPPCFKNKDMVCNPFALHLTWSSSYLYVCIQGWPCSTRQMICVPFPGEGRLSSC